MKRVTIKKCVLLLGMIGLLGVLVAEARGMYHPAIKPNTRHTRSAHADRLVRHIFMTAPTPDQVYYRNKVIVLMYHEVCKIPPDDKALSISAFTEQIKDMKKNGFHWITMQQYSDFIQHGAGVPDNAVLMTFDDGYESFYTDTYPVLQAYHVPATNFLITSTISNPKHIGIPKLTWEQIHQMHEKGIDFFNHTNDSHTYGYANISHTKQLPLLMGPVHNKKLGRMETDAEFEQRIRTDLGTADNILHKQLGNTLNVLAFPYGGYTKETLRICKSLGIDITFTVKQGINSQGQTNGYRVNAGGSTITETLVQHMKESAPMRPLPFGKGLNKAD